jgi:hypothetical protein
MPVQVALDNGRLPIFRAALAANLAFIAGRGVFDNAPAASQ